MTEPEWLACNDPTPMLKCIRQRSSERRLRLLAVACCRRIWALLKQEAFRQAVETAEGYADRIVDEQERRTVQAAALKALKHYGQHSPASSVWCAANAACFCIEKRNRPHHVVSTAVSAACEKVGARGRSWKAVFESESQAIARLLRDVAWHLIRSVVLDPAWVTPTVTKLAATAYQERVLPSGLLDTTRLAVLADALEEAGCTDVNILGHLRSSGPHVRGCWAVDLLLGKA